MKSSATHSVDTDAQCNRLKDFAKMCSKGNREDVEKFIGPEDFGDIDQPLSLGSTRSNWPALTYACRGLNLEVIQLLLEKGANPNSKTRGNLSPMMAVVLASSEKTDQLSVACAKLLVDAGVEVATVPAFLGRTLLTQTVLQKAEDLLEFFLEKGAEPNLRDGHGETPFNVAVSMNMRWLAETLIHHGANPYVNNLSGDGPLEVFIQNPVRNYDIGDLINHWQREYFRKNFHQDRQAFAEMIQAVNADCQRRQIENGDEGDDDGMSGEHETAFHSTTEETGDLEKADKRDLSTEKFAETAEDHIDEPLDLTDDASDAPTGPLPETDAGDAPTGLLLETAAGDAPTGLLLETDAGDAPTGLLLETAAGDAPTGLLLETDASDAPTGLLLETDASDAPTGPLPETDASDAPTGLLLETDAGDAPTGPLLETDAGDAPTGLLLETDACDAPRGPLPETDAGDAPTGLPLEDANAVDNTETAEKLTSKGEPEPDKTAVELAEETASTTEKLPTPTTATRKGLKKFKGSLQVREYTPSPRMFLALGAVLLLFGSFRLIQGLRK